MTVDEFARKKARERMRQWRAEHPEKVLEYARNYYSRNREKILSERAAKNGTKRRPRELLTPEQKLEKRRANYRSFMEKHPNYKRDYYQKNREHIQQQRKLNRQRKKEAKDRAQAEAADKAQSKDL